jgi:hypothetical protein
LMTCYNCGCNETKRTAVYLCCVRDCSNKIQVDALCEWQWCQVLKIHNKYAFVTVKHTVGDALAVGADPSRLFASFSSRGDIDELSRPSDMCTAVVCPDHAELLTWRCGCHNSTCGCKSTWHWTLPAIPSVLCSWCKRSCHERPNSDCDGCIHFNCPRPECRLHQLCWSCYSSHRMEVSGRCLECVKRLLDKSAVMYWAVLSQTLRSIPSFARVPMDVQFLVAAFLGGRRADNESAFHALLDLVTANNLIN